MMAWCIWTFLGLMFVYAVAGLGSAARDSKDKRLLPLVLAGVVVFVIPTVLLYFGGAFHAIGLN